MPEGQESDLKQIIKQYTSRNKIDYMDKEKQQLINSEKGPGRMARFSYVDTESQAHRDVEGSEMQELDVDIADNIQVGSPPSQNAAYALRTEALADSLDKNDAVISEEYVMSHYQQE